MARDIALEVAGAPVSAVDRTLLFAYASTAIDEPFATAGYNAALDDLVAQCSTVRDTSLYNDGLAGIGWVLAHVLDGDDAGVLARIDDALLRVVSRTPWPGDYELSQGLVGHGVYFLERLRAGPAPGAREGLARVVDQLAASAERTADGTCWFSRPELGSAQQRTVWPNGRYDCGLAHGVPGAVALLARAAALDDPPSGARTLCEDALRWLVAQRQPPSVRGGRFPSAVVPGEPIVAMPTPAWCYGDLGVAFALWHAGAHELARETALACASNAQRARVGDAGLCHGTAGVAHACQRFYQASGDTAFRDASRAWFAITLEADEVTALQGFGEWATHGNPYRLVNGAIGVALGLLAAVSPIEPHWDRWMLCDLDRRTIVQ
jgi:hypothetical protein